MFSKLIAQYLICKPSLVDGQFCFTMWPLDKTFVINRHMCMQARIVATILDNVVKWCMSYKVRGMHQLRSISHTRQEMAAAQCVHYKLVWHPYSLIVSMVLEPF